MMPVTNETLIVAGIFSVASLWIVANLIRACGARSYGTGLSPQVEPLRVSPPDGASIPRARDSINNDGRN
jgi:hypothetical protein